MNIRERCDKSNKIQYHYSKDKGYKSLEKLSRLYEAVDSSVTRYRIILAGNLKEYGECYSGVKTLYSSAYKRHGINVISKHISINSLRRVI